MRDKRAVHILLRLTILILLSVTGCVAPSAAPRPAPTRDGRWRQDVHYLAQNLARLHCQPFHRISQSEFQLLADRLDADIPQLDDHEVCVRLSQLVAAISDPHTVVWFDAKVPFRAYPLKFERFTDGVYVTSANQAHVDVIGAEVLRVGKTPIDDAIKRLGTVRAYDNEHHLNVLAMKLMRRAEILQAVGLIATPDDGAFDVMTLDGHQERLRPDPVERQTAIEWTSLPEKLGQNPPHHLRNRNKYYWFEYLPDSRAVYFAYNKCANMKGESFAKVSRQALRLVDDERVERFVLDLRYNPGGNSMIAWPLLWGLKSRKQINQPGRLFCLIGSGTFSSAELNAAHVRKWTNAILIGQPTAQKPNSFGEVKTFRLPNSGLTVQYSTKSFRGSSEGDPSSLMPDLQIDVSFAEYKQARDPTLEAALNYDR